MYEDIHKFYGKHFAKTNVRTYTAICVRQPRAMLLLAVYIYHAMPKSRMSSKTTWVDNYNYYYDDMVIMYYA